MKPQATKHEKWVSDARRLFRKKPKGTQVYIIDDAIVVCMEGVTSEEYCEIITRGVPCGCMLQDMRPEDANG